MKRPNPMDIQRGLLAERLRQNAVSGVNDKENQDQAARLYRELTGRDPQPRQHVGQTEQEDWP